MPLEKPVFPLTKPGRLLADFGATYAASALVAFLFAASGPVAIILAVGARGGLSESDIASWIFAAFFLNGLMSIAFSLAYRQDRKSTRLNSSHSQISYAVFCLK